MDHRQYAVAHWLVRASARHRATLRPGPTAVRAEPLLRQLALLPLDDPDQPAYGQLGRHDRDGYRPWVRWPPLLVLGVHDILRLASPRRGVEHSDPDQLL